MGSGFFMSWMDLKWSGINHVRTCGLSTYVRVASHVRTCSFTVKYV